MRFSDEEWAAIVAVASLAGLRPGAWVQQAAVDVAIAHQRSRPVDWVAVEELVAELRQHRRVLTNIGGNVNDLARVANSTGTIGNAAALRSVLRLVRNVVLGSDELVRRVRREWLP